MGAVTDNGTLLLGTNTFTILMESITDWVNYCDDRDDITGYEDFQDEMLDYDDEERKSEGDDYDLLEGKTIDEAYDEASNMTLD